MSDTPNIPDPAQPPVPPAPVAPTASGLTPGAPLPPPVPQAAAAPRQKARTAVVVGAVVGVVTLGGAIFGLLNVARADDSSGDEPTVVTFPTPGPTAPVVPGAGTVPAPVTLPGPSVAPPVTTEAPATTVPAPTTVPVTTTPAPDTEPPVPVTVDTIPAIEPPDSAVDTIAPPIITQPPDTTVPSTSGDTVDLGNGVIVSVPDGWSAVGLGDQAFLSNGSSSVWIELSPETTSAADLLFAYKDDLTQILNSGSYTDIQPTTSYSPSIVDSAVFSYFGYLGDTQSGVAPYSGQVYGDVRVDGVGVVTDLMWPATEDGNPPADDLAGINEILSTFVYGP